jgi:hypothetical protein
MSSNTNRSPALKALVAFLAATALVFPLVVYVATFGASLSASHARWAEFGSAMSGIYSPIVAIATLLVLLMQVRLQRQVNDHQYDQTHIQQARADIEFFLVRLEEYLSQKPHAASTVRDALHERFQPPSVAELNSPELRVVAEGLDTLAPRVLAVWGALYSILAGLKTNNQHPYIFHHTTTLQKIVVMLSFETCVSLDHFSYSHNHGRISFEYEFSPLLSKASVPSPSLPPTATATATATSV